MKKMKLLGWGQQQQTSMNAEHAAIMPKMKYGFIKLAKKNKPTLLFQFQSMYSYLVFSLVKKKNNEKPIYSFWNLVKIKTDYDSALMVVFRGYWVIFYLK